MATKAAWMAGDHFFDPSREDIAGDTAAGGARDGELDKPIPVHERRRGSLPAPR